MKDQVFLQEIIDRWDWIYTDLPESRRIKRELIKKGYDQQISFYGVVTKKETEESEFKRIEVLANKQFTQLLVSQLFHWFKQYPPLDYYSIWKYDKDRKGIKLVRGF